MNQWALAPDDYSTIEGKALAITEPAALSCGLMMNRKTPRMVCATGVLVLAVLVFQSCASETPSPVSPAKKPDASSGTEVLEASALLLRTDELSTSQRLKYENMDVPHAFSFWLEHGFTLNGDKVQIIGTSSFQLRSKQLSRQSATDTLYIDIWTGSLERPLLTNAKRHELRYPLGRAEASGNSAVIDPVYLALVEGLKKQSLTSGFVRLERLSLEGETLVVEFSVR